MTWSQIKACAEKCGIQDETNIATIFIESDDTHINVTSGKEDIRSAIVIGFNPLTHSSGVSHV